MAIFDRQGSAGVPLETRIVAADALGQAGDPRIDFRRDDYWVGIPAGRFLMGAQSKAPPQPNYDKEALDEREFPVHEVSLDAFRIARYPVTVGQFRHFVEDDGYLTRRWWQAGGFGETKELDGWADQQQYPSRPVVSVSWYEAAAFSAWAGFRLPTEAEWERAARGTEGRKYPWGDEPADGNRLNCHDWRVGHPTPVGIYPLGATSEGICDLAGNVWEWCQDGYGEYPAEPVSNPAGSQQATLRVSRGGSWALDAEYCRSAYRSAVVPASRLGYLGFRVAAVPQAKSSPGLAPSQAEPGAQAEPAHAERSGAEPDRAGAQGVAPAGVQARM